ncbi:MAG: SRPBCC domain-containing protein [Chloroflexota bacterium]
MTEPVVETVEVAASPEEIWGILDDPVALGRILPGCESIVRQAPDRFSAVVASKVKFMTVRSDVTATIQEADPPRHLRLVLEGRPRGLGGSFRLDVPFDIVPLGQNRSSVAYSVALELGGSLKGFGGPTLTQALGHQIGELVQNIEKELPRSRSTDPADR